MSDPVYDSVLFYCPECKESIFIMFHNSWTCKCGLKWICMPPVNIYDGKVPIMEINGETINEDN
jgi:hypothetical protein